MANQITSQTLSFSLFNGLVQKNLELINDSASQTSTEKLPLQINQLIGQIQNNLSHEQQKQLKLVAYQINSIIAIDINSIGKNWLEKLTNQISEQKINHSITILHTINHSINTNELKFLIYDLISTLKALLSIKISSRDPNCDIQHEFKTIAQKLTQELTNNHNQGSIIGKIIHTIGFKNIKHLIVAIKSSTRLIIMATASTILLAPILPILIVGEIIAINIWSLRLYYINHKEYTQAIHQVNNAINCLQEDITISLIELPDIYTQITDIEDRIYLARFSMYCLLGVVISGHCISINLGYYKSILNFENFDRKSLRDIRKILMNHHRTNISNQYIIKTLQHEITNLIQYTPKQATQKIIAAHQHFVEHIEKSIPNISGIITLKHQDESGSIDRKFAIHKRTKEIVPIPSEYTKIYDGAAGGYKTLTHIDYQTKTVMLQTNTPTIIVDGNIHIEKVIMTLRKHKITNFVPTIYYQDGTYIARIAGTIDLASLEEKRKQPPSPLEWQKLALSFDKLTGLIDTIIEPVFYLDITPENIMEDSNGELKICDLQGFTELNDYDKIDYNFKAIYSNRELINGLKCEVLETRIRAARLLTQFSFIASFAQVNYQLPLTCLYNESHGYYFHKGFPQSKQLTTFINENIRPEHHWYVNILMTDPKFLLNNQTMKIIPLTTLLISDQPITKQNNIPRRIFR